MVAQTTVFPSLPPWNPYTTICPCKTFLQNVCHCRGKRNFCGKFVWSSSWHAGITQYCAYKHLCERTQSLFWYQLHCILNKCRHYQSSHCLKEVEGVKRDLEWIVRISWNHSILNSAPLWFQLVFIFAVQIPRVLFVFMHIDIFTWLVPDIQI